MGYVEKAKASFKTRMNVYLFKLVVENKINNNVLSETQIDEFYNFNLEGNKKWVELYVTVYYQEEVDKTINEKIKKYVGIEPEESLTPSQIYSKMKDIKNNRKLNKNGISNINDLFPKYLESVFKEKIFPMDEYDVFQKNCQDTNSECAYCGISLQQIHELGENNLLRNKRSDTRGYQLEIDRKEPNYEYTPDNIVLSCYWCNNAKTDEFSYNEFKSIGTAIRDIWDKRISEIEKKKKNDKGKPFLTGSGLED